MEPRGGWTPGGSRAPSGSGQAAELAPPLRRSLSVLPSTGDGLGIVSLEAESQGKPSIGNAGGAVTEILLDGRPGLLVSDRSLGKRPKRSAASCERMNDRPVPAHEPLVFRDLRQDPALTTQNPVD